MQKFFKGPLGQVFAYLADGSEDQFIPPGLTPITSEEAHLLVNPPISAARLKDVVTNHRWIVETGGLTLPAGVQVATGLDDQNRITTVVANARMAGLESVKFKAASGWITLSVAELEGVAAAVARHVQACFSAECEHHQAIDAIALIPGQAERQTALESYDVSKGWPEN